MAQQALGPGTDRTATSAPCSGCSTPTAGRGPRSRRSSGWSSSSCMLGYLPGPCLLPDGRPDGRPGRPRLVADQPLPADERDRCRARRRSGRSIPWETSPDRAGPARSRAPTAPSSRSGPRSCTSAAADGTTAQSTVYVAQTVGTGNFDTWAEGPPLPEPRADASVAYVAGSIYVIGGRDAGGRPDDDGLRAEPGPRRPAQLGRVEHAPMTWPCPRPRSETAVGDHARRPAADRRAQRRRAGRDDLEDAARRPGRARARGRRSSRSSTPQADATARAGRRLRVAVRRQRRQRPGRPRSSAARSASRPPRACRRTRTRASSIRWDVNDQREPAGAPHQRIRLGRQRRDLPGRRQRRLGPQDRALLGGPDDRRRPARVEAPAGQRPARAALRARPPSSPDPNAILVGGTTPTARGRHRAFARTPRRRARSSSSASSGRPCPDSRSRARSASSSATSTPPASARSNFIILLLIGWAFAHKAQTRAIIARRMRSPTADAAPLDQPAGQVALRRARPCRGGPAGRHAPRPPCRRPR